MSRLDAEPLRTESIMLVRAEIVTPRNGPSYLKRIEQQDPRLEHLCLELVHWGFNEIMTWIGEVQAACRRNPKCAPPFISVHGSPEDVTGDMVDAIVSSGAMWMSRSEKKTIGKDPVTILYELLACKPKTTIKTYPPKPVKETVRYLDPDDYREDVSRYMTDGYNPDHYRSVSHEDPDDEPLDLSQLVGSCDVRALPDEEFEELLRTTMHEINGENCL